MALAPEKLRTVSVWPVPYGVWLDQQRLALENFRPMGRVLTRRSLGGVDDSCTGTPHCTPWPAALLCLVTTDNLLPSQGLDASLIHSLTHWTLQIIHRAPIKGRTFKTRLMLIIWCTPSSLQQWQQHFNHVHLKTSASFLCYFCVCVFFVTNFILFFVQYPFKVFFFFSCEEAALELQMYVILSVGVLKLIFAFHL